MGNLAPMYLVLLHWHRLMSVTESTEVKPNLEEKNQAFIIGSVSQENLRSLSLP